MAIDKIVASIDNEWFFRFGCTLVIGFCIWFAFSLLLHIMMCKKNPKDSFRIVMLFMYYPSRMSVLVWAPWLGGVAKQYKDSLGENLDSVNDLDDVNKCLDQYAQFDVNSIKSELEQGYNMMSFFYISMWICCCMLCVELLGWIVFGVNKCMNNVSKRELARNMNDKGSKADVVVVGGVAADPAQQALLAGQPMPPTLDANQQQAYAF